MNIKPGVVILSKQEINRIGEVLELQRLINLNLGATMSLEAIREQLKDGENKVVKK